MEGNKSCGFSQRINQIAYHGCSKKQRPVASSMEGFSGVSSMAEYDTNDCWLYYGPSDASSIRQLHHTYWAPHNEIIRLRRFAVVTKHVIALPQKSASERLA